MEQPYVFLSRIEGQQAFFLELVLMTGEFTSGNGDGSCTILEGRN